MSEIENLRDDSSENKRLEYFRKLIKVNEIFRCGEWNCEAKEGRWKIGCYKGALDKMIIVAVNKELVLKETLNKLNWSYRKSNKSLILSWQTPRKGKITPWTLNKCSLKTILGKNKKRTRIWTI